MQQQTVRMLLKPAAGRFGRFKSVMQKQKAARAIKAALTGTPPPRRTGTYRFVTPGEFTAGLLFLIQSSRLLVCFALHKKKNSHPDWGASALCTQSVIFTPIESCVQKKTL